MQVSVLTKLEVIYGDFLLNAISNELRQSA